MSAFAPLLHSMARVAQDHVGHAVANHRQGDRRGCSDADAWRQVALAALLVASHAARCAAELGGSEPSDRPEKWWFRAVRHAWRDAPAVLVRVLLGGELVEWHPPEAPRV